MFLRRTGRGEAIFGIPGTKRLRDVHLPFSTVHYVLIYETGAQTGSQGESTDDLANEIDTD